MKKFRILGIFRLPMFSNNAVEADRLILEHSLEKLRALANVQVDTVEEHDVASFQGEYDLVLTMAQSYEALDAIEQKFPRVLNTSKAIRNCYRKKMSQTLGGLPVNYVPFQLCDTSTPGSLKLEPNASYWLKRSDFHAISDEDVTLAESQSEAEEKLKRFHARGVKEVLVQRHVHGDIYKFYGVDGQFFRAIKVRDFLTEKPTPNLSALENVATKAASALGVMIYGGDAILDEKGNFHLIDLNDWPSFRICRPEASEAIARKAAAVLLSVQEPAYALER